MSQLQYPLYRSASLKACEQWAQKKQHISSYQLMIQAGTAVFAYLLEFFPSVRRLAVFCGAGNNGGDGYVVARLAQEHGLDVTVYQCKEEQALPEPARQAALAAQSSGVEFQSADEPIDADIELIVDALLGTGSQGVIYGLIAVAIEQINASDLPVLAIDLPSGLDADTGMVANLCVHATRTLTLLGLKTGLFTMDGPDYCGIVDCHDLGLQWFLGQMKPEAHQLHQEALPLPLLPRKKNSHKGCYGHILILGGGKGMPGAVALAAKAALYTGAGAVSIATLPEHVAAVVPLVPEAMVWGIEKSEELTALLEKATFCIIGPGLGDSDWAQQLFAVAIGSQLPMLIDASGLRWLGCYPQTDDNWILTPHPGEAAALLSCPVKDVQSDRYRSAALIQQKYGGVVVLKGAGSIIHTLAKDAWVCTKGNPAMASAGMGDVLSGVIAGLSVQGLSLSDAALLGVWVHALAADILVQQQRRHSLLASDLLKMIPLILNG
ncbi:MAG: bifunctional ADP-dependent NAD(P)H-hydrate dehydratase/NAD(P)H-hydrate epimerase [Legionella sp.]|nr:MAG: bifunctional ADP-dependent NAD(P)H-hydrate dehydratase/NAD(P)H-hydrate epimerase [Legionella sp.]PJD97710.1 MAG: bifunctional ADP-dependent NAD(P)H-hydrate dehydratase/NAD(P)H-hydrate epimerase [Legionella sp.]